MSAKATRRVFGCVSKERRSQLSGGCSAGRGQLAEFVGSHSSDEGSRIHHSFTHVTQDLAAAHVTVPLPSPPQPHPPGSEEVRVTGRLLR